MRTVRHSTASGRLDEGWDWNRLEQRIEVRVRDGNRSATVLVLVCSEATPKLGSHPIRRVDGEAWCVVPARYVRIFPNGIERLAAIACPIGDVLTPGEQLLLTNTPPAVNEELEAL